MRAFTFSSAERAAECPGSQALPHVPSESEHTRRGTILHAYVRDALVHGPEVAIEMVPDDLRDAIAGYPLDGLPLDPDAYRAEVAFAVDLESGSARLLGFDLDRRYDENGAGPTDIVGAADFVSLLGDRVAIDDLKTGWRSITAARSNLQLAGLAMAAARFYQMDGAYVRLLVRREDGSGYFDGADLDAFDLDWTLMRLRRAAKRVMEARADVAAGRVPPLKEGPWCGFCPARWGCPAKMALVRQLALAPRRILDTVAGDVAIGELSDEELATALERLRLAKAELHAIEAAIGNRARERAIPLGDGLVYGERTVDKKSLDGRTAHRVIETMHGRAVADLACEFSTSQAAIGRALQTVAPRRGLTKMRADTLAKIADAGGITVEKRPRLEIFRPRADAEIVRGQTNAEIGRGQTNEIAPPSDVGEIEAEVL